METKSVFACMQGYRCSSPNEGEEALFTTRSIENLRGLVESRDSEGGLPGSAEGGAVGQLRLTTNHREEHDNGSVR